MREEKTLTYQYFETHMKDPDYTIVFSSNEMAFLRKFKPSVFLPSGSSSCQSEELNRESRIILGKRASKFDFPIYSGNITPGYASERLPEIEEIAMRLDHDFDREAIVQTKDPKKMILAMKTLTLDLLVKLVPSRMEPFEMTPGESTRFSEEIGHLQSLVGYVPLIIFGSSVRNEAYNDIDFQVIVPMLTEHLYDSIYQKAQKNTKPSVSFLFVPQAYLWAYYSSLPSLRENTLGNQSLLVHYTALTLPLVDEEENNALTLADTANGLFELRRALLPDWIEGIANIKQRQNYFLKLPKFIYQNLIKICPDFDLPKEDVAFFSSEHGFDRADFATKLISANVSANKMIEYFMSIKKNSGVN